MNTAKIYYDSEDNECTINQMVRREPEWAANIIQWYEAEIAKLKANPVETVVRKQIALKIINKIDSINHKDFLVETECKDCKGTGVDDTGIDYCEKCSGHGIIVTFDDIKYKGAKIEEIIKILGNLSD